jgi:dTDP-glucose 4,6-dehydratase
VKVLITGAAGFLGSHLTDRFLAEGHEVVGVDNFLTGVADNLAHLADHPRFRLLRQDVSEPLAIEPPLDGVLHLASPASPVDYLRLPLETLRVGSEGTRQTLDLARACQCRYLLTSTSEVYGDPLVHPQPESYWGNVNPVGPRSVYDEAKRFAEALTSAYRRRYGLDTRIARVFNTYGPRMRLEDGRVVSNFVVQALRGQPLTLYGDGSQTRSFCFVDDLIEGIWRLFHSDYQEPVNLGNPTECTVRELAELVQRLTDAAVGTVEEQLPVDDPQQRCPDIRVARERLGWEPRISLEEGLRRTIAYFRGRLAGAAA